MTTCFIGKILAVATLFLIPVIVLAQKMQPDSKTVFISTLNQRPSADRCHYIAVRITSRITEIDTCCSKGGEDFKADEVVPTRRNRLFRQVYRLKDGWFRGAEASLNRIEGHDYLGPIEISLSQGSKPRRYSLKQYVTCYPKNCRRIMKRFDRYLGVED